MIKNGAPLVTVIMPTYKHEKFIRRAVNSLLNQTLSNWELVIINDGSPDETEKALEVHLTDPRIRYFSNKHNTGLGACLNAGIEKARSGFISYLPSDDIMYKDHLQSLYNCLRSDDRIFLAYSSLRHYYNRKTEGIIKDEWPQLIQVMHKRTPARWMERSELESDDLNRLFWNKLDGKHVHTGTLTCEWVDHPDQRYKIMREPIGGINTFRSFYKIKEPLRYHTTCGNFMDEMERYANLRNKPPVKRKRDGLKILIVGELAYNAERVLALEEKGNKLFGLWMKKPYWYNYVGPLPFGHVEDISGDNWEEEIARIQPDIIYALLNWQAVPFAHEVLRKTRDIPFVWHFKEGPFICLEKGMWNEMVELYSASDGRIYISDEMKMWLDQFIHKGKQSLDFILDGDLPKKDWFTQDRARLLSDKDGAFHTVVPGRPIGLHPYNVVELAKENIHLHFYGDFTHGQWKEWIDKTDKMAPGFLHIHSNVDQENWVTEFSKFDAGWLHFFESENHGEIARANWDDLNIPARMSTLALAGLPMLQKNNEGHLVAMQSLAKKLNVGLFFNTMEELRSLLEDKELMKNTRKKTWEQRRLFTFDYHAEALIDFFKAVIKQKTIKKPVETSPLDIPAIT